MARPREFNLDDALENALNVFWNMGYADTTLPDLLEGMKISRGSFYKAFKDKKSLFLTVLSNYDLREVGQAVAFIEQGRENPSKQIVKLFEELLKLVAENNRRGCLLCTTLADREINDPEIAKLAMASLERMQQAFQAILEPQFPKERASSLAHLLTTQYVGMRLLTRTQAPIENFRQSVLAVEYILQR